MVRAPRPVRPDPLPRLRRDWWDAWEAYRRVNERFADAVVELSPEGAVVLVQDYHLTLLAPSVRAARPDLSPGPLPPHTLRRARRLRVLPPAARDELLGSLAAHDACGFHTAQWSGNFADVLGHWRPAGPGTRVFASSLSSDAGGAATHGVVRRTATSRCAPWTVPSATAA